MVGIGRLIEERRKEAEYFGDENSHFDTAHCPFRRDRSGGRAAFSLAASSGF